MSQKWTPLNVSFQGFDHVSRGYDLEETFFQKDISVEHLSVAVSIFGIVCDL